MTSHEIAFLIGLVISMLAITYGVVAYVVCHDDTQECECLNKAVYNSHKKKVCVDCLKEFNMSDEECVKQNTTKEKTAWKFLTCQQPF